MAIGSLVEILRAPLASLGYNIVCVQVHGAQRITLEILIEHLDESPVTVADCAFVSKQASALLDVSDPIKGSYLLQVSSPGLDRPLVKKEDFERFISKCIKVSTFDGIGERKRFRGVLKAVREEGIELEVEDDLKTRQHVNIPFQAIRKARLVPIY